jgi:hypothetical protein
MTLEASGLDPAPAETISPDVAPEGAKPAEGAAPATAAAEPSAASTDDLKKEIGGIQKRFDELTRRNYDALRDRDDAIRERDHLRTQLQRPEPQSQAVKTLADFEFDEAKFEAHRIEQSATAAREAVRKELKEKADLETSQRQQGEFWNRAEKFAESAKDFHETLQQSRITRPEAAELSHVLVGRELGPDVTYHLAKNPPLLDSLLRMSSLDAAVEVGRIEAKLIGEREKAKAATPVVSKAPPPAPKIEAGDAKVEKDPSEMTDSEFAKWRGKHIAQRR